MVDFRMASFMVHGMNGTWLTLTPDDRRRLLRASDKALSAYIITLEAEWADGAKDVVTTTLSQTVGAAIFAALSPLPKVPDTSEKDSSPLNADNPPAEVV